MSTLLARVSLFTSLGLLVGCGGDRPPDIVPESERVKFEATDDGLPTAKAIAKRPPPSPTAELDLTHAQVSAITPDKLLSELAVTGDKLPPPVLRAGDQIDVTVLNQPSYTGQHVVSPDGVIHIPVLGAVPVLGLTSEAVAQRLAAGLAKDVLRNENPSVTVRLGIMAQRSVKVLGRVRAHTLRGQTGLGTSVVALPPNQPISVYGLLTLVQGLDEDADAEHLTLVRKATPPETERRCYHFSYKQLSESHHKGLEVWLEADDEVIVPRLADVYVYGAVTQPGRYPLREGTTAASLILRAGGLRIDADERGTRLLQGEEDAVVDLSETLAAGQVIFVPPRKRVYVVGRGVARNGPLVLPPSGMTAVQAIGEAGWFTLDGDMDGVELLRVGEGGRITRYAVPVEAIMEGARDPNEFALRSGDTVYVPEAIW